IPAINMTEPPTNRPLPDHGGCGMKCLATGGGGTTTSRRSTATTGRGGPTAIAGLGPTSAATGSAAGEASITIASAGGSAGPSTGPSLGPSTEPSIVAGSSGNAGGETASMKPATTSDSMALLYRNFVE